MLLWLEGFLLIWGGCLLRLWRLDVISDSHIGIIFPKGLLGNVWRHFCFHGLRWGVLLVANAGDAAP